MTVTAAPPVVVVRPPARRMNLWRLEWLRLTRTPRAITLAAVFLFVGLVEPVVTRYEQDLVGHLSHGARISLPPPTPAAGLNSYVSEITLVGLVVVVAIAAGALTFDARPGISTFLRTRVTSMTRLLLPRFAVSAAAAVVAYLLGTLGAWYETSVLLGPLPARSVLAGFACGAAYMVFAVAVTALAAALARSVLGAVGTALAILILLPIAGAIRAISGWLPSALVNAPASLAEGQHLAHYGPALAVTAAASAAALVIAARRLRARPV
jgi:ABC-2 type transport system permease protein